MFYHCWWKWRQLKSEDGNCHCCCFADCWIGADAVWLTAESVVGRQMRFVDCWFSDGVDCWINADVLLNAESVRYCWLVECWISAEAVWLTDEWVVDVDQQVTASELSWIASTVSLGQVIAMNYGWSRGQQWWSLNHIHDDDHGRYHNPCRSEVQWRVPG